MSDSVTKEWSFNSETGTATCKEKTTTEGGSSTEEVLFTISGLRNNSITSETTVFSSYFSFDGDDKVKVTASALSGLNNGDTLAIDDLGANKYSLVLDTGINKQPHIDTSADPSSNQGLTISSLSGNEAKVTAKLTDYAVIGDGNHQITYYQAQGNVQIATIKGLANVSDISISGGVITLKDSNLKFTTGTQETQVSIVTTSLTDKLATGVQLDTSPLNPAALKFALAANGTSGENGNEYDSVNKKLGFKGDGNEFAKVEGDNSAVTYNAKKMEGWTLSSDEKSISYTAATSTPIVQISGLKSGTASTFTDPAKVQYDSSETSVEVYTTTEPGKTLFKIHTSALGQNDIEITNVGNLTADDFAEYALALNRDSVTGVTISETETNTVGFGNKDGATRYWTVADGTVTYQYDIAEGWTLETTGTDAGKIKYSKPNTTETIILKGTGIASVTKNDAAPTGITFTKKVEADSGAGTEAVDGKIVLDADAFDKSQGVTTVTLVKNTENYTLDLAEGLATGKTVDDTSERTLDVAVSAGTTYIKGKTKAYYTQATDSRNSSYTYHAPENDVTLVTITGLGEISATAGNMELGKDDDGNYLIKLKDAALGTSSNNVKLDVVSEIAGIETEATAATGTEGEAGYVPAVPAKKYKFDLSELENKKSVADQVDLSVAPTFTIADDSGKKKATITNSTLGWYELKTDNTEVEYHVGGSETIAYVSGLSSTAAATTNVKIEVETDAEGNKTRKIVLGKGALASDDIRLQPELVGGSRAHNLVLAFDDSILTTDPNDSTGTTKLNDEAGFGDSGNYWVYDDTKTLTYQHNTEEGWKLNSAKNTVTHVNAESPIVHFELNFGTTTLSGVKGIEKDFAAGTASAALASDKKYSSIDGITITTAADGKSTVTIDKSLLGKSTDWELDLPDDDNFTFQIIDKALTNASASNSVGFGTHENEPYWYVKEVEGKKVAYYQYDTDEGWKIEDGKIKYYAKQSGDNATVLATVEGLKLDASIGTKLKDNSGNDVSANFYSSLTGVTVKADGTITLSNSVLDGGTADNTGTGSSVELKNEAGQTYKLALEADVSDVTNVAAGIGFKNPESIDAVANLSPAMSKVEIVRTRKAGWEFQGDGQTKITYKGEVNDTLAKIGFDTNNGGLISGLKFNTADKEANDPSNNSDKNFNPTALYLEAAGGNYTKVVELDGKNIKLNNAALAQHGVTLTNSTTDDKKIFAADVGYKLVLAEDSDSDGKIGYDNADGAKKYWHVDATTKTTATYQYDVGEGWTIAADGSSITYNKAKRELKDDETAYNYAVEAPEKLVTVEGLRAKKDSATPKIEDLTDDELNAEGIITVTKDSNNYNVITIDPSVLTQNTTTLTDVKDDSTYKLAIKGDGVAPDVQDGKVGFDNVDGSTKYWTFKNETKTVTATLHYDYGAGWTLDEQGKVHYTAGGTKELAEIEGLAGIVFDDDKKYAINSVAGITVDGTKVKLSQSVLNKLTDTNSVDITITDKDTNDDLVYTLELAGTTTTDAQGNVKLGFAEGEKNWKVGTANSSTNTATYQYTIAEGWTLYTDGDDKGKIKYTEQQADKALAVITGLKDTGSLASNIKAGGITVSSTSIPTAENPVTFTLNQSVLNNNDGSEVKITTGDNYKLAVKSGENIPTLTSLDTTVALNYDKSATDGEVTLKETRDNGWYLDTAKTADGGKDSKELKYYDAENVTLATVSGLKKADQSANVTFDKESKTITIAQAALGGESVTLKKGTDGTSAVTMVDGTTTVDVGSSGYKLALKDATGKDGSNPTFGFENKDGAEKYWVAGTGSDTGNVAGEVYYRYNVGAGWTLKADGTVIDYSKPKRPLNEGEANGTVESPVTEATIKGLKTGLTAAQIEAGIKLGADKKTITLSRDVLGTGATDIEVSGTGYSLALDTTDPTYNDNKVGFENADGATKYWKVSGTAGNYTATFLYDEAAGWTLETTGTDAGKIKYTAAKTYGIVTITGLKTATGTARTNADGSIKDGEYTSLDGITFDETTGTFKLAESVLSTTPSGSVELKDAVAADNILAKSASTNEFKSSTFKLAFDGDTGDDPSTLGFKNGNPYWNVTESSGTVTAAYQYDIGKGWQLKDEGSGTGNKIIYVAASDDDEATGTNNNTKKEANVLATITGLDKTKLEKGTKHKNVNGKTEVGSAIVGYDSIPGLTVDGTTFTISKDLFSDGTNVGLSNITGQPSYKLALVAAETVDGKGEKIGFEDGDLYWAVDTTNHKVTYQYDTKEGWTLKADGTGIDYAAAKDKDGSGISAPTVMATISGLNGVSKDENGTINGIRVADDGTTFIIDSLSIFGDSATNAELTHNASVADGIYKLALDPELATQPKVKAADTVRDEDVTSGVATIKGTLEEYVEKKADTEIKFIASQSGVDLAKVTNLGSGATKDNVTFDKETNVISLSAAALSGVSGTVSLSAITTSNNKDIADLPNFTLALKDDVATEANQLDGGMSVTVSKDGTAKITQGTKKYYSVSYDGQSVTHTAATTKTLAEITGLKPSTTDITVSDYISLSPTKDTTDTSKDVSAVIKLKAAALNDAEGSVVTLVNKKVGGSSDHGLTLEFDTSDSQFASGATSTVAGLSDSDAYWKVQNGVAIYEKDIGAKWTIDQNTNTITCRASYTKDLAKITGLVGLEDGIYKDSPDDGEKNISVLQTAGLSVGTASAPSNAIPFEVKNELLGTAEVSLIDLDEDDNDKFELKLADDSATVSDKDGTGAADNMTGFSGLGTPAYYWIFKDGTASYVYDVAAGWTSDTEGNVTYTPAQTRTAFIIEGITGIENGKYKSPVTPATDLTGSDKENGFKNFEDLSDYISDPEAGTADSGGVRPYTVTLKKAAFSDNDITITAGDGKRDNTTYKLALDGSELSTTGSTNEVGGKKNDAEWVVDSSGKASYLEITDKKWTINTSGTLITYSKSQQGNAIATLSGIKSGVTSDQLNELIELDKADNKTFVVHKDALGTSDMTFWSTKSGNGSNAKDDHAIKLGGDVPVSTTKNYWTYSGTTGTYKQDTTEGWSLSGTTITHQAATTGTTLATLKNLKKNLELANKDDVDSPNMIEGVAVSGDNILVAESALPTGTLTLTNGKNQNFKLVYNGDSTTTPGLGFLVGGGTATLKQIKTYSYAPNDTGTQIKYTASAAVDTKAKANATIKGLSKTMTASDLKFTEPKTGKDKNNKDVVQPGIITLKADALNKANVTLTSPAGEEWLLELDDGVPKAEVSNSAWTLNKTTATMKGNVAAGYRVASSEKSVTYVKAQTNATLLTISGLPSGAFVKDNEIYVMDSKGEPQRAFYEEADMPGKINVTKDLLAKNPSKLTLKGTGYEFVPFDDDDSSTDAFASSNKTVYDSGNIYVKSDVIISGKDANEDGDFDDTDDTRPGVNVWRVSGTTAVYKRVIPAHYELKGNTITYVKEKDYTEKNGKTTVKFTYATVSGLKKGLTVSTNGQSVLLDGKDVIYNVGATTKTSVQIEEEAIGGTTVKFTPGGDYGYTLNELAKASGSIPASYLGENAVGDPVNNIWTVSGTTATLKAAGTLAGWNKKEDAKTKAITYTKQGVKVTDSTVLAKITGLKKGVKVETDAKGNTVIEGITLGAEKGVNVITVDNKVLPTTGTANKTKVTLTNGKETYELRTSNVAEKDSSAQGSFWSVSGTNVILKSGTKAEWTQGENTEKAPNAALTLTMNKVAKQDKTPLVTIKGLKKGLALKSDNTVTGVALDDKTNTITISEEALTTSNVTVTNSNYHLALANNTSNGSTTESKRPEWSVSGTKAILKEVTDAKWTLEFDTNKIVYSKPTSKVVATIDGIKKGLKVADIQNGIEIVEPEAGKSGKIALTLSADVLDSKTVKLTGDTAKYELALDDELKSKDAKAWVVSGTTVSLKEAYGPDYFVENNKLTYYSAPTVKGSSAGVYATITNLKKGLKVTNGEIDGISFDKSDPNTIVLSSKVLGTSTSPSKLNNGTVNGTESTYNLALDEKDESITVAEEGYSYAIDKTTGNVKVSDGYTPKGYVLENNDSQLTYHSSGTAKEGAKVVATISGLSSSIKVDSNKQIAGIKAETKTNGEVTFTIDGKVLGDSNVSITKKDNSDTNTYKLALDDDITPLKNESVAAWAAKGGAAVMTLNSEGGYYLTNDGSTITYEAKGDTKVVVSGLGLADSAKTVSGLTADTEKKTIEVASTAINKDSNDITASDGYRVIPGTGINGTFSWEVHGTTASYIYTAGADNWVYDGIKITKGKQGDTRVVATITGLPEGFTKDKLTSTDVYKNGIVELPTGALTDNTNAIKITGAGYTLKVPDVKASASTVSVGDEKWSVDGTTAYLASGKSEYYSASSDGKTVTFQPFQKTKTIATVKGLASDLKPSIFTETPTAPYNGTDKTLTLTKDMLGDTDVTITSGYALKLGTGVPTGKAEDATETWTFSKGTLTIKSKPETYYTEKNTTTISATVGKEETIAKITGLATDLTLNDAGKIDGIKVDNTNKTIKVSESVLTGKAVTLTDSNYSLILADDVAAPTVNDDDYVWSISGTTATLKAKKSLGYTLDSTGQKITYTGETTPVVAKLTGLAKGLKVTDNEIEGIEFDGETITLSQSALGTTEVKLTDSTYTLALNTDDVMDADDDEVVNGTNVWVSDTKNNTATYKSTTPAHYKLEGNSIKYNKEETSTTALATIKNIANFTDSMFDEDNKTVKVSLNNLVGKEVSISGDGYELELDDEVSKPAISAAAKWTQSGTTATFKGERTAGYEQTDDQTIKYIAADKTHTFASITGVIDAFEDADNINADENKLTLYARDLDDQAVTVSSDFSVEFLDYNEASITGSSNSDSISVDGDGLTISAGAGDDYIDLGLAGGNTLIYTGGNDVIADFTATGNKQDKLVISSGTIKNAVYDDGDAILTLDNGNTITLKDFNADSITYFDSKDVSKTEQLTAANLLESDNFFTAETELDSLVNKANNFGDLDDTKDLTGSDLKTLTKQSNIITYGNKK